MTDEENNRVWLDSGVAAAIRIGAATAEADIGTLLAATADRSKERLNADAIVAIGYGEGAVGWTISL